MYKIFSLLFFTHSVFTLGFLIIDSNTFFEKGFFWVSVLAAMLIYIGFPLFIAADAFLSVKTSSALARILGKVTAKIHILSGYISILTNGIALVWVSALISAVFLLMVGGISVYLFGKYSGTIADILSSRGGPDPAIDQLSRKISDMDKRLYAENKSSFDENNEIEYRYDIGEGYVKMVRAEYEEPFKMPFEYKSLFPYRWQVCVDPEDSVEDYDRCVYVTALSAISSRRDFAMIYFEDSEIIEDLEVKEIAGDLSTYSVYLVTVTTNKREVSDVLYPSERTIRGGGSFDSLEWLSVVPQGHYKSVQPLYIEYKIVDDVIEIQYQTSYRDSEPYRLGITLLELDKTDPLRIFTQSVG